MPRRYFFVRIVSSPSLSSEQLGRVLTDSVRRYFGEFGLSRIDPRLIRFDSQRCEAIIACRRGEANDLQAALALLSSDSEARIAPIVLRISGTIKGLKRKKRR